MSERDEAVQISPNLAVRVKDPDVRDLADAVPSTEHDNLNTGFRVEEGIKGVSRTRGPCCTMAWKERPLGTSAESGVITRHLPVPTSKRRRRDSGVTAEFSPNDSKIWTPHNQICDNKCNKWHAPKARPPMQGTCDQKWARPGRRAAPTRDCCSEASAAIAWALWT